MSQYKRIVNKLLLHIKSGDKEKINDLFKLTFDHIKIIAITNLFNKNDYEDVVEETFLRIIKYIGSFNHLKDGYNWICKIVENVAKDFNRENQNFQSKCEVLSDVSYFNDDIAKILINDAVVRIICGCSAQDRTFFYLRFYADLSYGEIARRMNCSKSYVHKRVEIVCKRIENEFERNC